MSKLFMRLSVCRVFPSDIVRKCTGLQCAANTKASEGPL